MGEQNQPRRTKPATMKDVAERAGVSRALVSIVFRNLPGASDANRERVRQAAQELGYAIDHRARLLSRARSKLIGVVYGLHHEFHAELVEALYTAAESSGYEIAISGCGPTRTEEDAVASLLSYRCESLILLGPTMRRAALAALAEQVPTVVAARKVRAEGVDVVRTDDVNGGRQATNHLIQQGHRRIVYVDGGHAPGNAERRQGYRRAMQAAHLSAELHTVEGGLTEEDGARAATALLPVLDSSAAAPSGIFAFNDRCALGVLTTLRTHAIDVPRQMSLVGYDDSRVAGLPWANLTTMRQNRLEIATQALELAVTRMEQPQPGRDVTVAPELVQRSTTADHRRVPFVKPVARPVP